jgi:glycosyltransferase involved in cell wall biosynthesis
MSRFRGNYFVIWSHHCDSNRWLRVALAISRQKYAIVERAVAPTCESLKSSRLTSPLLRLVSRKADKHVFCGAAQMEGFTRLFNLAKSKCKLIPNSRPVLSIGSSVSKWKSQRAAVRFNLNITTEQLLICVGRLDRNKGQAFLIQALASLPAAVGLLLVGDGPAKHEFEQLAHELAPGRVTFVSTNDPASWLAAADIFVFPSLAEGLSGALIEAMAASLPCVVTDIPGNRELVLHGITGLCVPPQDAVALAGAISMLLGNPSEARRLAEAGYSHVLRNYDETIEASLWRTLFSEIAGMPGPE